MIDFITPMLQRVDRKIMLINAARLYKGKKSTHAWVMISHICGVGSTSAQAIAEECGWDPFGEIKDLT